MSKFNTKFSHLRINTGEDLSMTQKQKANNIIRNENTFRLQSPKIMGNTVLTNRPVQVLYTSPTSTKNQNTKNMSNNYLSAWNPGQQGNNQQTNNNHQSGYLYTVSGKTDKMDYNSNKTGTGKNNNLLSVIKSNLRGKNNEGYIQNFNTHYNTSNSNKNGNPIYKSSSVTKYMSYNNNAEGKDVNNNNNNKFLNKNSSDKQEVTNYVANLKKNLTKEVIGGYLHSEGNVSNYSHNNNNINNASKIIRNNSVNKNINTNNMLENNKNINNNNINNNINEMPKILKKEITIINNNNNPNNNNNAILSTPVHNNQILMNHNLSARRDIFTNNKTERNSTTNKSSGQNSNIKNEALFMSDQKKKLIVNNNLNNINNNNNNSNTNLNSKYFSNSLNKNSTNKDNNDSINYEERVVHTDVSPTKKKTNKPEMIDIMKLISSNQPPISLNVLNKKFENFENSKYSTKSLKYIKGYSANTHQGTVR